MCFKIVQGLDFNRIPEIYNILGQPFKNTWQITSIIPALKKYRKLRMDESQHSISWKVLISIPRLIKIYPFSHIILCKFTSQHQGQIG